MWCEKKHQVVRKHGQMEVGRNAEEHGQIPLLPLCDVHNIVLGPPSLKRDSRSCVYIYEFDYVASYTVFFKDMCKQSYAYTS